MAVLSWACGRVAVLIQWLLGLWPSICCLLPTTYYRLPTTDYRLPTTGKALLGRRALSCQEQRRLNACRKEHAYNAYREEHLSERSICPLTMLVERSMLTMRIERSICPLTMLNEKSMLIKKSIQPRGATVCLPCLSTGSCLWREASVRLLCFGLLRPKHRKHMARARLR